MQDIGVIPVFIAVIEQKSLSGAARQLGITTSAISKRITRLEAQLGVRLLHRSTRRLSLTEAGERYYQYALQALHAAETAENSVTELQQMPKGILRASVPTAFARMALSRVMPAFIKQYPQVRLHIELNDVFSAIRTEDFDVVVASSAMPDPSLNVREIGIRKGVVCASPQYLEAHGAPRTPQDLFRHNCLLLSFFAVPDEWVFLKNGEEIAVQVSGNYQVNDPEVVQQAALQDIGICCLPLMLVSADLEAGRLVPLLQEYEIPTRGLYVSYLQREFTPERVRVFVEFLMASFGEMSPAAEPV